MTEERKSYRQILKSSSIMGSAQGFNLVLGILRVKCVAWLIGPTGLGLLGIYNSILNVASTASGLGINSSGVREVAEASGTGKTERVSCTIHALKRLCWLTGIIGGVLVALLSVPISHLMFDSSAYAGQIALLGLSVLMGSIAAGQMAMLQGMRRIADLAKVNIISTLIATIAAICYYWWLGLGGIIPALVTLSASMMVVSFLYARRVQVEAVEMSWRDTFLSAKGLILLGFVFMLTALMTVLVELCSVSLIRSFVGIAAVGIYSAAMRLSGMFLNFILNAMGADFYPRLTEASDDHHKMRALVNHQTEIGLLLAVPGLLATIVLAPWIITLFYTKAFVESAELLQWLIIGCLGRVISWPMGFIIIAKGAGRMFLITETLTHITHLLLIWMGLQWLGLQGVAIAFCSLNLIYPILVMRISRHLIGFQWSVAVKRLLMILLPLVLIAMLQSYYSSPMAATILGSLMTLVIGIYCLRELCLRLGEDHALVTKLGMIPGAGIFIRP